jgi:cell division protein FtsQ
VAKFTRVRFRQRRGAESRARAQTRSLSRRDCAEVLAVIAVLALIVLGVYKLREPGSLPIQRVHFENGPFNAAPAALRQAVAPYLVGNFFTVDLQAIERALTRLGWVKSASVRREWPGQLSIRVREHTAVARWGMDALLNRNGQIFRPQGGRLSANLPILHGPAGRSQHVLAEYRQISNTLRPINVSVRALVEDERWAWHMLLGNGIPVDIGRGDPNPRVARFARVYPEVLAPRAEHIESIDLRYTNGLAVAWKWSDGDGDATQGQTGN